MLLKDLVKAYQEHRRMSVEKARIRVCQDQLMEKLVESSYSESFTFKGGTVMYELTQNARRSTMDVDMDAIRTSISKDTLIRVFNEIGAISPDSGISFHVIEDTIKELNHQSYKGKRLTLTFEDSSGDTLPLVLDIGVHTCLDVEQRQMLITVEPSKTLLRVYVNPPEQIVAEKTVDIVKKGILSTRMKDIFDVHYIISNGLVDKGKLTAALSSMIQMKQLVPKTVDDYIVQYVDALTDPEILSKLKRSDNWLEKDPEAIVDSIKAFFLALSQN